MTGISPGSPNFSHKLGEQLRLSNKVLEESYSPNIAIFESCFWVAQESRLREFCGCGGSAACPELAERLDLKVGKLRAIFTDLRPRTEPVLLHALEQIAQLLRALLETHAVAGSDGVGLRVERGGNAYR